MAVDAALLNELSIARRLSTDAREALATIATIEQAPAGSVLFREGDPPGDVFFVLDGRVTLTMRATLGESAMLTLGTDEIVGWSSLLHRSRVATATVSRAARLLRIPASALLELCERDPRVGYAVMAQAFEDVSDRLVDTRMQWLDLYGKRS